MKIVLSNKKKKYLSEQALLKQQSERIKELRSDVQSLTNALEEYRKREKEIVDTLDFARKKGEEYTALIRVKYALECERIKQYREKLEKFRTRDELIKCYDNAFEELRKWQIDMEQTIANDLGSTMSDYLEERKRLNDEPHLDYGAIINSASQTDLDVADRITEDELAELLEQI